MRFSLHRFIGVEVNGNRNWLKLPGRTQIQPSGYQAGDYYVGWRGCTAATAIFLTQYLAYDVPLPIYGGAPGLLIARW